MSDPKKKVENPLFTATENSGVGVGGEENESRRRLLSTAGRLFAEKGFDGVSTRDIANSAGVNISLISYYFNGKEGLYTAVLRDACEGAEMKRDELFKTFKLEEMTKDIFVNVMTTLVRELLEMKIKNPFMPALIHRELIANFPRARVFVDDMTSRVLPSIFSILETAQKKGIIRQDLHIPTYFMTMVHAIDTYYLFIQTKSASADMCMQLPQEKEAYIRQNVIMFIEGVLK